MFEGRAIKSKSQSRLDQLWFGRPIRQHVREFAAIFGVLFNGYGLYLLLFKASPVTTPLGLAFTSVAFYFIALAIPSVLVPVWDAWMKFAHYLGMVMTSLILAVAWVIAFLPMAAALKILRIKVMNVSFRQSVASYWESRDGKYDDFKLLERQF